MTIFSDPFEFIKYRKTLEGSLGFVPTMGALHNGHISLIKRSVNENKKTIVSIFVNPTQFLEGEDFQTYPKKTEADIKICKFAGVEAVFMPKIPDIYKDDELSVKAPDIKSFILEGFNRPGHFNGVLQIVLKLFNIINPDKAYFGKKDAQQLYLIEKMTKNLFLDIDIIPCEIIREDDGLALSSRNVYLNSDERLRALTLSKSLKRASKLIMSGEYRTEAIKKEMKKILKDTKIEYVEIVSRDFQKLQTVKIENSIVLVAAKIGSTRLIDNIWI